MLITGLVRVLFVRVWEPVIVATSPVGVLITGRVRILFVRVSEPVKVTKPASAADWLIHFDVPLS